MPARRWTKLAILHRTETTYGQTAAVVPADAIIATNVSFTPIEGDEVSRDLLLPYMGQQGVILAGTYGRIEFDVEIAGAGAAGTAPKYGSLLRICGMAETTVAGTSVTYSIVESGVQSGTLHFNMDGVRHALLGCFGTVTMSFAPKAIPHYRFTITGLLGTIDDAALPAVTMTGWTTPAAVSKANTTMTLHGWPSVAESLELDLGNTVTPRHLIGDERIMISDRKATGRAVVEATTLAQVDWFDRALKATRGALSLVHGKTPGNIVQVDCPAVQIGKPTQGQTDGLVNYTLPLSLCPVAGMDELTIVVK